MGMRQLCDAEVDKFIYDGDVYVKLSVNECYSGKVLGERYGD